MFVYIYRQLKRPNMKNKIIRTAILCLLTSISYGQLKYKLPDATLTANQICGKDICDPGNVGFLLHLTSSPFSPSLTKATKPEDIILQVLGKTLPSKRIRKSKDFNTCSDLSNNPFTDADVEKVRFPDGKSIEYERKEKLEINVNAAVDANIKQLMKLTTDAAKIEKLRLKIEASYQKVKGKELTITGNYWEWELSSEAREKLKKGDGFQSCRQWIERENQRIILAVGLVYFDIKYEEKSLDQLAAEIDAELAKEGISGGLSFTFKKEITKRFKTTSDVYQILIIRHAGISGKSFVEEF